VGDSVGVQRLDSRDEPPLIEESARIFDPYRSEQFLARAEVLGDGGEQGVMPWVLGRDGFGSNEVLAIVDRSAVEQLYAPKGKPQSSRFVALGQTLVDLKADVGDTRALIGHLLIVGAGCLDRRM